MTLSGVSSGPSAELPGDEPVPAGVRRQWSFQFESTRDYLIPWLERNGALPSAGRVLEAGAGYAGCLAALRESRPGLDCEGLELKATRTDLANRLFRERGGKGLVVRQGDLTVRESLRDLRPPYELVILRDVIEHIEARRSALANIRSLLAPSGAAVFSFPSYVSPYGGHQQNLVTAPLRVPWLQLTPLFLPLVRRFEPAKYDDLASIRRCHLTTTRFDQDLRETGFEVVAERHFLSRPIFKYRYGLPVLPGGPLARIPLLKDLLLTAAWYVARPSRSMGDAPK